MIAAHSSEDVKASVEALCRVLVDHSEAVRVNSLESEQLTVFEIRVAGPDHGKLLGRRGRTASAIRQLLLAMGGAHGHRFALEFLEPDRSAAVPARRGSAATHPDPVELAAAILRQVIALLVDVADELEIEVVRGTQVVIFEVSAAPWMCRGSLAGAGGTRRRFEKSSTTLGPATGCASSSRCWNLTCYRNNRKRPPSITSASRSRQRANQIEHVMCHTS